MPALRIFPLLVALFLLSNSAWAAIHVESPDAGAVISAAQSTVGDPLNFIQGHLSFSNDIDVFAIEIVAPGTFSATMTANTNIFDPELFLFDKDGRGVLANDDTDEFDALSRIPTTALTPGLYFLVVAEFADKPVDEFEQLIFPDFSTTPPASKDAVVGPTGPGGANHFVGWAFDDSSFLDLPPFGDYYEIELVGARGASVIQAVPEPSTFASLAMLGPLAALGLLRERWTHRRSSC